MLKRVIISVGIVAGIAGVLLGLYAIYASGERLRNERAACELQGGTYLDTAEIKSGCYKLIPVDSNMPR